MAQRGTSPVMNCKQISKLVSDSIDQKLPLPKRMQLWMHLAMCGLCSRFNRSVKKIDAEVHACVKDMEQGTLDANRLPERSREKIRKFINEHRQT
ncbi:MAG: hypothetical protein ACI87E_002943 [Mariniblastus sp.]|jgi:hypothetical protein